MIDDGEKKHFRFCIYCKHLKINSITLARCTNPTTTKDEKYHSVDYARENESLCGKKGRFWELSE